MFTGLVQRVGRVVSVEPGSAGVRLLIDPEGWEYRPAQGDSINVSGCCLTVAAIDRSGRLGFDAVPETLSRTILGGLGPGSRVNLEHAVTAQTLMGGHIVQGHVDGVGTVGEVVRATECRLSIMVPVELKEFLTPKGSITVDGVSLTIAGLDAAGFEVALIPTTLERTTLGGLEAGSACNLEMDIVAKTIVHYVKNHRSG